MEIEDLKTIWQKYDSKLDHLEKLNKKLVMETLSKKPQRKLDWIKMKSVYASIFPPIIIILALHQYFKIENIDLTFVIGCLLTFAVMAFLVYISFKSFLALKGIDLSKDSIIESARKVNKYKDILNVRHKYTFITYPVLYVGIILIVWKGLHFNMNTMLFMIGLFVFSMVWSTRQFKVFNGGIERLEKEILDLNEYTK